MTIIVVDVEADGPCPGLYSLVCFGAVVLRSKKSFYGQCKPLENATWQPEALAVSGFTRQQHECFDSPNVTFIKFYHWVKQFDRPTFVSDNPAFDWQFVNYYFHKYCTDNPFGFSARRIGDFYAGLKGNFYERQDWKKWRKTKHTHNPVDDAMGNVEALERMLDL